MCECKICERNRVAADVIKTMQYLGLNHCATFLDDVLRDLENAELELSYANAVIDGSWINADEIIENARKDKEPIDG